MWFTLKQSIDEMVDFIYKYSHRAGGPAYYVLHYTPKKVYHLHFKNLQGFQKPGSNFFPKKSCWVIKDIGISGVSNLKLIFLAPPPLSLIIFFGPKEIYYNGWMRAAGENFQAFFCNFVNFKSIGEKICILEGWGGGSNRKICTPEVFWIHKVFYGQIHWLG